MIFRFFKGFRDILILRFSPKVIFRVILISRSHFLCASLQQFSHFSQKMRSRGKAILLKGHLEITILAAWYWYRHQQSYIIIIFYTI